MPWEVIEGVAVFVVLAGGVYRFRKRIFSSGPTPEVGKPPQGSQSIMEPRLQDNGLVSYELPLPGSDPGEGES